MSTMSGCFVVETFMVAKTGSRDIDNLLMQEHGIVPGTSGMLL